MPQYLRIPGGEKNKNSGRRWNKHELRQVRDLYLSLCEGCGIHENNPLLHQLSMKLSRTVRSVEAQLHMFKNLHKGGRHAWGHMSKLCIEVWQEYLDNI